MKVPPRDSQLDHPDPVLVLVHMAPSVPTPETAMLEEPQEVDAGAEANDPPMLFQLSHEPPEAPLRLHIFGHSLADLGNHVRESGDTWPSLPTPIMTILPDPGHVTAVGAQLKFPPILSHVVLEGTQLLPAGELVGDEGSMDGQGWIYHSMLCGNTALVR